MVLPQEQLSVGILWLPSLPFRKCVVFGKLKNESLPAELSASDSEQGLLAAFHCHRTGRRTAPELSPSAPQAEVVVVVVIGAVDR